MVCFKCSQWTDKKWSARNDKIWMFSINKRKMKFQKQWDFSGVYWSARKDENLTFSINGRKMKCQKRWDFLSIHMHKKSSFLKKNMSNFSTCFLVSLFNVYYLLNSYYLMNIPSLTSVVTICATFIVFLRYSTSNTITYCFYLNFNPFYSCLVSKKISVVHLSF